MERAATCCGRGIRPPCRPLARGPQANFLIGADDGERPLDQHRVKPVTARERCDVLATYVDAFRGGHVMRFDIALHLDGRTTFYPACRCGSSTTTGAGSCPRRA